MQIIVSAQLKIRLSFCFQLLLLIFISLQSAFAASISRDNVRFRTYGINEGLSQATVRAIAQDRTGLMWFGTQDGLNRFDGYNF